MGNEALEEGALEVVDLVDLDGRLPRPEEGGPRGWPRGWPEGLRRDVKDVLHDEDPLRRLVRKFDLSAPQSTICSGISSQRFKKKIEALGPYRHRRIEAAVCGSGSDAYVRHRSVESESGETIDRLKIDHFVCVFVGV